MIESYDTGGKARNTPWPLVSAVIKELLHSLGCPVDREAAFFVSFDLWVLEGQIEVMKGSAFAGLLRAQVDAVMRVLAAAARNLAPLLESGCDASPFEIRLAGARRDLDALVARAAQVAARGFTLPSLSSAPLIRDFAIAPPMRAEPPTTGSDGLMQARALAARQLGSLPLLADGSSPADALDWARKVLDLRTAGESRALEVQQLVLASMERVFVRLSATLASVPGASSDEIGLVPTLEAALDLYRTVSQRVGGANRGLQGAASGRMAVEVRSREVLCVWICCCLVHRACAAAHPLLRFYRPALDPGDLRLLVLQDKREWDAALSVHAYLSQFAGRDPLFSLSDQQPTFKFAEAFAAGDGRLQGIWNSEKAAAAKKQAAHWEEVLQKQSLCKQVRKQIVEQEYEIETFKNRNSSWIRDWRYQGLCDELAALQKKLEAAENAPAPVFQPLPKREPSAMRAIFFLYMPPDLQSLGRLVCSARQSLMPRGFYFSNRAGDKEAERDFRKLIEAKTKDHAWIDDYYKLRSGHGCAVVAQKLRLGSSDCVPRSVGPDRVDQFISPSDGVWYPDTLCTAATIFWSGGNFPPDNCFGGAYFNPFMCSGKDVIESDFTEIPPDETDGSTSSVYWAMPIPKLISKTRGNEALARQDSRPGWLTKPQFLCFGGLRAFPHEQFQKVCRIIGGRTLPLEHLAVHLILKQALFQLGTIREHIGLLEWKQDQLNDEWQSVFEFELSGLVQELSNAPCSMHALRLAGELASFASQWSPSCTAVARMAAKSLFRLGGDVESQVSGSSPENKELLSHLRAKQHIIYLSALLCFQGGSLSPEDAEQLCQLSVLCKMCFFFEHATVYDAERSALCIAGQHVLADRITEIDQLVRANHSYLTKAIRIVIENTPHEMDWTNTSGSGLEYSGCYEAVFDSHLYNINLLTGVVLFDGTPPGRLSNEILEDANYKRAFKNRDFQIIRSEFTMRTTRAVEGRFYEFTASNGAVEIVERHVDPALNSHDCRDIATVDLELLDGSSQAVWQGDLPPRLKELYSHWFWRAKNMVLLRGQYFLDRGVSYIIHLDKRFNAWRCLRIPDNMREYPISRLVGLLDTGLDRLGCLDSHKHVLKVLSKFESSQFIDMYESAGGFRASFPRFHLEFELRENSLYSVDYAGYRLCECQQFENKMFCFSGYLLLQKEDQPIKVLIPRGRISVGNNLCCTPPIESSQPENCEECRSVYDYSVHPRFGHLEAGTTASRIHLAYVYAESSTLLPEPILNLTGVEQACSLLRGCWVNRPLTSEEEINLQLLDRVCGYVCPALKLLCHYLAQSSRELHFLHLMDPGSVMTDNDAQDSILEYQTNGNVLNFRQLLTPVEEMSVFNKSVRMPFSPNRSTVAKSGNIDIDPFPIQECVVSQAMQQLGVLLKSSCVTSAPPDPQVFPLSAGIADCPIGRDALNQIKESWDAYHQLEHTFFKTEKQTQLIARVHSSDILVCIKSRRMEAEMFIMQRIDYVPKSLDWHSDCSRCKFRLQKLSNSIPTVGSLDLMKIALDPNMIKEFYPFLSLRSYAELVRSITSWLELCCLEDKLDRLLYFLDHDMLDSWLTEMQCVRQWNVNQHVEWLVFEVEQRIRIRPNQYRVAQRLIQHLEKIEAGDQIPGPIEQLNMGEGKTRVIVPMLLLFYGRQDQMRVSRVHFLSALLPEAFQYLHRILTAGVFNRPVLLLPFNRDVELTVAHLQLMYKQIEACRTKSGCICMAREHRLSLQLKLHELMLSGHESKLSYSSLESALLKVESSDFIIDIFDESDEILRHKFQLVYAVGDHQILPAGQNRWNTIQALLRIIRHSHFGLLSDDELVVREDCNRNSERFLELRLVSGETLQKQIPSLLRHLAEELVASPPYELFWLSDRTENHQNIISFITLPSALDIGEKYLAPILGSASDEMQSLWVLRGLLAFQILPHCLQRRHRVDFGIPRPGKKRLAVPFRAADTPSERAEFNHPDVALSYTILSYYYDGLNSEQTCEAFTSMLLLGLCARRKTYTRWLDLSRKIMPQSDYQGLDDVLKIDLSNEVQRTLLIRYFSRNAEVINFWLNTVVFPSETMQFTQRLMASPWDLCAGRLMGFSGTKDNKQLLPLQVRQSVPHDQEVRATDGKMLALLSRDVNMQFTSVQSTGAKATLWQNVLSLAVKQQASVLIDAGGLIAGIGNRRAGTFVLGELKENSSVKQAVLFFDTHLSQWIVCDAVGREWPLCSSPIQAEDAFVFIDEVRCRGTDLQLKQDARAVLTVGPKMCKDKLMQAAARMRLLQKKQSLFVIGTEDVARSIRKVNEQGSSDSGEPEEVTTRHVLNWAMKNTIQAIVEGLPEWAKQGIHFCHAKGVEKPPVLKETTEPALLYCNDVILCPIDRTVESYLSSAVKDRLQWTSQTLPTSMVEMLGFIDQRIKELGSVYSLAENGMDVECERELEKEVEMEMEVEIVVPKMLPQSEVDWEMSVLFSPYYQSASKAAFKSGFLRLCDFLSSKAMQKCGLQNLEWMDKIYITSNFARTVQNPLGESVEDVSQYLRLVDTLLIFPNDEVLLVSEREADALLRAFWQKQISTCPQRVEPNFSLSTQPGPDPCFSSILYAGIHKVLSCPRRLEAKTLVRLLLFSGETNSPTPETGFELTSLLDAGNPVESRAAALALPSLRGLSSTLPMSDLETACKRRPKEGA